MKTLTKIPFILIIFNRRGDGSWERIRLKPTKKLKNHLRKS